MYSYSVNCFYCIYNNAVIAFIPGFKSSQIVWDKYEVISILLRSLIIHKLFVMPVRSTFSNNFVQSVFKTELFNNSQQEFICCLLAPFNFIIGTRHTWIFIIFVASSQCSWNSVCHYVSIVFVSVSRTQYVSRAR